MRYSVVIVAWAAELHLQYRGAVLEEAAEVSLPQPSQPGPSSPLCEDALQNVLEHFFTAASLPPACSSCT